MLSRSLSLSLPPSLSLSLLPSPSPSPSLSNPDPDTHTHESGPNAASLAATITHTAALYRRGSKLRNHLPLPITSVCNYYKAPPREHIYHADQGPNPVGRGAARLGLAIPTHIVQWRTRAHSAVCVSVQVCIICVCLILVHLQSLSTFPKDQVSHRRQAEPVAHTAQLK
jgi:hypothetical protein